jgi:hypothetical protein
MKHVVELLTAYSHSVQAADLHKLIHELVDWSP